MGTTNYGTINQNCIVGPAHANLTFDPAIAEELASKLPPSKPIQSLSVGHERDHNIADQYLLFLQNRGFQIARHDRTGTMIPEPEHPITIYDVGDHVNIVIAPSMRY